MTQRIRLYPYKVTYISLSDYLSRMLAYGIPLHTDIVTALHANDARAKIKAKVFFYPIVVLSASRYPQRLGQGVIGMNRVQLTDKQKSIIDDYIKDSGRGTPVPHKIAPSAFVPKPTPFSDRFRPIKKVQPEFKTVPAPPTVFGDLSVGGFSFGASEPAPVPAPVPAPAPAPAPVPAPDSITHVDMAVRVQAVSESNAPSPVEYTSESSVVLATITIPFSAVLPLLSTPQPVTPAPTKNKSWRKALRFLLGAVSVVGALAYIWHR